MTTAPTFRELIAAGRIVEAKTLLTVQENADQDEELLACGREIEQRYAQAASLVAQAEALEQAGKTAAAKAMYESVLPIAADFAGLQEHIKRMDEALFLTRAVKHRCERLRATQPEPAVQKPPSRPLPWIVGGLAVGLGAAAWLLFTSGPKTQPPAAMPPTAPQSASVPSVPAGRQPAPAATPAPAGPSLPAAAAPKPVLPQTIEPAERHVAAPKPAADSAGTAQTAPAASPQATTFPVTQQPTGQYVIQAGDSLSQIAERLFCHEPLWHEIYERNRATLTNPAKLQVGDVLQLQGIVGRCPAQQQGSSPPHGATKQ